MSTFPNIRARRPRKNTGRSLEAAVIASQRDVITVAKIPNGMKYIGGGKTIPTKAPVDFVGVVNATGRAICFDAKQCDLKHRFPIGNPSHVTPHQIAFLRRMGAAGAKAGLLIECTANNTAWKSFYWLDWQHIRDGETSIEWSDVRLVMIGGDTARAIPFENIPGINAPASGAGQI